MSKRILDEPQAETDRHVRQKLSESDDAPSACEVHGVDASAADGATVAELDDKATADVVYMTSPEYVRLCCEHPKLADRVGVMDIGRPHTLAMALTVVPSRQAELVHTLIECLGYLKYCNQITPVPAKQTDLEKFHDPDYVETLRKASENCDDGSDSEDEART